MKKLAIFAALGALGVAGLGSALAAKMVTPVQPMEVVNGTGSVIYTMGLKDLKNPSGGSMELQKGKTGYILLDASKYSGNVRAHVDVYIPKLRSSVQVCYFFVQKGVKGLKHTPALRNISKYPKKYQKYISRYQCQFSGSATVWKLTIWPK